MIIDTRGLDRTLFQKLAEGDWIDVHENLICAVLLAALKRSRWADTWRAISSSAQTVGELVSVAKRKIALRHGRFYGRSYVVFFA